MVSAQHKIAKLTAFRQSDKFSDRAWHDRGLNPSSTQVSLKLTVLFNECADALVDAVQNNASDKQLLRVLKSQFSNFNKRDYDTAEREYICSLFYELAQIVNIHFSEHLNRWLYGATLTMLMKISAILRPERVIDTISQTCKTCGGAIDTFIMKKEEGIPDYNWHIVQCKSCKDFSLVSYGPNVKSARAGNYDFIEQLPKKEFTKEQAEVRLEQVRYFRSSSKG